MHDKNAFVPIYSISSDKVDTSYLINEMVWDSTYMYVEQNENPSFDIIISKEDTRNEIAWKLRV